MADFYEQWSVNPAENNQAPPLGAGENRMPFDQITDTFRVVMAACAQLGGRAGQAKGMATQSPDNVAITGGNIGANVSIAAEALKSGIIDLARIPTNLVGKAVDNLTLSGRQQLYNWINPVGIVKLWYSTNLTGSGLIWPGLTAVWQIVPNSGDRIIMSAGTQVGATQGAGTMPPASTLSTSTAGAHSHGGGTAGATLARAHLPTDAMVDVSISPSGGVIGSGSQGLNKTFGSGAAHAHVVTSDGSHAHSVVYDPYRYGMVIVARLS